jgi:hypothetical protein
MVSLGSCATLRAGANTVVLRFQGAVNIDNFLFIGDINSGALGGTSVGYAAKAVSERSGLTLRPAVKGFVAALPAGHGFTSYSVVDIQGRAVRTGKIGASDAELSVSGLKHSVVFLRLEGKGKTPTALKVVTY